MDQLQEPKDPIQELQKKLKNTEKLNIDLQESLKKLQSKHSKLKILSKNQKDDLLKKSQDLENEISKGKKLKDSALIIENTNKSLFDRISNRLSSFSNNFISCSSTSDMLNDISCLCLI